MAIQRGGPKKPATVRPQGTKAAGKKQKAKDAARPPEDQVEVTSQAVDLPPRALPGAAAKALAGRALIELEKEVSKLDTELGKLLEVFAASDSEEKLWSRLRAQRNRLEKTRRRYNRVRRQRRALSATFAEAPVDAELAARLSAIDRGGSDEDRFEALLRELDRFFDAPSPSAKRRVTAGAKSMSAGTLLLELAGEMIEILRPREPDR